MLLISNKYNVFKSVFTFSLEVFLELMKQEFKFDSQSTIVIQELISIDSNRSINRYSLD